MGQLELGYGAGTRSLHYLNEGEGLRIGKTYHQGNTLVLGKY